MAIIKTKIDINSADFAANDAHMRELVADLQKKLDSVELGGGEKAQQVVPYLGEEEANHHV